MPSTPNKTPKGPKRIHINLTWLYLLAMVAIFAIGFSSKGSSEKEISYTQFRHYVDSSYIDRVIVINKDYAEAHINASNTQGLLEIFNVKDVNELTEIPLLHVEIPSPDAFDTFMSAHNSIEVRYESRKDYLGPILYSFGPILLFVLIWVYFFRRMNNGGAGPGGGGIFNVGKSQAKLFDKGNSDKVTFKDVAGLEEAKQEVQEIVDFLKNPKKYTDLGGKIPKGALLVGPPGTGKTLLAKAVAGEADVPFFSMSGSDFVEMFVGVGASRVRDLFRQAKEKAPCIIFIDEIDAVGRARGKNPSFNSNDERENTLNQLLTEMDGFGSNSGVIILAATNRADILDKALLRAGRFDRQIHVDLPDVHEREAIFKVHLRPIKLDNDLNVDFLAKQTPGFSGAEIANVCNEAALIAARHNHTAVQKQDFLDAVDRIIGGLERKNKIMTAAEKASTAVHEAGHASVSWLLEYANPLVKVTIVPRGNSLGAAWYLPEERVVSTKQQMLDEICSLLAGKAAEQLVYNQVSTGALSDLERATKIAYSPVVYYGMSEKIPNISYYNFSQNDYAFSKPYSEKTAEQIDLEVKEILQTQFERATKLIRDNREKHQALADLLVENEVIFTEDVERIFGKRPWVSRMEILSRESSQNNTDKDRQPVADAESENTSDTAAPTASDTDQQEETAHA
ncbi:MAG: ATP-dependent zinc metalloprotease FtsH [Paludibacteraceae bacterium]|nr:ATP-dependent zinc metalloprotease FtsH [Paludibacteraceae bacterium]